MTTRSNVLYPSYAPSHPHTVISTPFSCSLTSSLSPLSPSHPVAPPALPSSVKGAPPHLRQVIRKRQNSQSAKRSRLRRKDAARRFYQRFDQQCQRISALEQRVAHLIDLVRQRALQEKEENENESDCDEDHDANDDHKLAADLPASAAAAPCPPPPAGGNVMHGMHDVGQAGEIGALGGDGMDDEANGSQGFSGLKDSSSALSFEEDLEALLDSCIQAHYGFDDALGYDDTSSPFS